jgi:hypothetical protein
VVVTEMHFRAQLVSQRIDRNKKTIVGRPEYKKRIHARE